MGNLFDRGAEPICQALQIVTGLSGGFQKGAVGHQRGPGEIIRQADLGDGAGGAGLKAGEIERGLEQIVLCQQRHLVKQLEPLCRAAGSIAQDQ